MIPPLPIGHFPGDLVWGIVIGALLMWLAEPYVIPRWAALLRWLDGQLGRRRGPD